MSLCKLGQALLAVKTFLVLPAPHSTLFAPLISHHALTKNPQRASNRIARLHSILLSSLSSF